MRSALRVMCKVAALSPIHASPTWSYLPAAQQTGSYHLHYNRLYANRLKPNSETRLETRNGPVEPRSARTRSSSRIPKEVPVEVVRQIWAVVASAGQAHSCRVVAEARSLKRSNVHRCRAMSTGEEGRCRTARHELLKMMPHTDNVVALVRAHFLRTLRGNAPPRRIAETCTPASATGLLSDIVVYAGGPLRSGTAVGEVSRPAGPGVELLMPRSPLL